MKILFILLFYLLAGLTSLYSQIVADSIVYNVPLVNTKGVEVLKTGPETTFKNIKESKSFKPYDYTYITDTKTVLWLKFELENQSKDIVEKYIFSEENYVITFQENENKLKIFKNGNLFLPSQRTNKLEYSFTKIRLYPFQKTLLYVRLYSIKKQSRPIYPVLYSEKGYWELSTTIRKEQSKPLAFLYFNIAALITIFIFALIFCLHLRKKIYFYYLGYLLFLLIYGFQVLRTTSAQIGNVFEYFPQLSLTSIEPVQFTFIGFYIFFILHLLAIKRYDRLLAKILFYFGLFCFVYAISRFIFSYFFYGLLFAQILFVAVRVLILPINLILIFWIIYKVKHPLINYFILGQSFFFVAAVLASFVGFSDSSSSPDNIFNFIQAPNIIFQVGLLAEVFCFSLALGKNVFLLQKEKEIASANLIDQLNENKIIQYKMNRELDGKVQEKTKELIQLYSKLEKVREQKTKDDFAQKIKETEMVALRSQMNPHFIFNSLSGIKNLIINHRNEDAIRYLDDFSSLIRGILQNSNREVITVEEELEILELYLSLEKNRLGTEFNYKLEVTSREGLSQYQIPPLLLQPLVENAIWHGLHPSLKSEKILTITFSITDNLKIIIEDNGIGRKESTAKKKLHKSMGTTIVQDRVILFNHLNDNSIHLNVIDLEEDGRPLGTRIILTYEY